VTNPVPGYNVSTPYGRRGSYWSCDEDANGNGIHTGVDYAAPTGTKCVAARPGVVNHSNHGSAFGYHQIDILPGDGTRDFYAHMRSRVADGTRVEAGDKVGEVGAEGNVTGAHLHFERHVTEYGGWSCSVVRDPAPSINYAEKPEPPPEPEEDMPKYSRTKMTEPMGAGADWKSIPWDVVVGDAGKEGAAYLTFGAASTFSATLTAKVTPKSQAPISTRFVEKHEEDGKWVDGEQYPPVEHIVTSGVTFISDTRNQSLAKGNRLVAQIKLSDGGTLENAELNVLYF
jgi:hypothetical protein